MKLGTRANTCSSCWTLLPNRVHAWRQTRQAGGRKVLAQECPLHTKTWGLKLAQVPSCLGKVGHGLPTCPLLLESRRILDPFPITVALTKPGSETSLHVLAMVQSRHVSTCVSTTGIPLSCPGLSFPPNHSEIYVAQGWGDLRLVDALQACDKGLNKIGEWDFEEGPLR